MKLLWNFGLIWGFVLLFVVACNDTNKPNPTDPSNPAEPKEFTTGLIKDPNRAYGVMHFCAKKYQGDIPEAFDWEALGYKTPLRDQGSCGSCWAFASTQTIESAYLIFGKKVIDFSEQELVSKLFYGCGGGWGAGEYQVTKGQTDEASCKYTASNSKCPAGVKPVGKGSSWGYVGKPGRSPSDQELQTAIQTYGVIWVTVGANSAFMNIKTEMPPSGPRTETNHMVALTGWKTVSGKVYYKVKNSWGASWGKDGYAYLQRLSYNLAEEAGYIAVDAVPCNPPKIKLPAQVIIKNGDEIVLAVKKLEGVSYAWFEGGTKLSDTSELIIAPESDTVYRVVVKNQCGEGEVQTLVTLK